MTMNVALAVSGHDECPPADLEQLSKLLRCPLYTDATDAEYVLYKNPSRLELFNPKQPNTKAIFADFVEGKVRHRRLFGD